MNDLISRLRRLESDHEPEGYPPVKMKEITALVDACEDLEAMRMEIIEIYAGMDGGELKTPTERYLMLVIHQMYMAAVAANVRGNRNES